MQRQGPVLVVDDEPDLATLMVALLESEGYRTALASSGREALAYISRARPSAVLLDLSLPDIDGLQVLRLLKGSRDTATIPVLVVSAYTGRMTVADRALANSVFDKPFDIDALSEAIRVVHERTPRPAVKARRRPHGGTPAASVA